jgi:hypothetical protein
MGIAMVHKTSVHGLRPLLVAVVVACALLTADCTRSPLAPTPPGTEVVVFIDFSGSINKGDKALFQQDLANLIVPSLGAGDRLLIAAISDKTFTDFHPIIEATFPPKPQFNGWMDNTLKYNQLTKDVEIEVRHLRERIRKQISEMFARAAGSPQTDIFSSLLVAQKLFDQEPRNKVLVLMSDMVQDYPPYRFEHIKWNAEANAAMLKDLSARGFVPDLSGVGLYVSGISAPNADMAERISDFWHTYFERTHVDMSPSRYAHVLLHWPPEKACTWSSPRPRREKTAV